MHQNLSHSKEAVLNDKDAPVRSERGLVGGVPSHLTRREICLLAMFWALILVQASTAGSLAARPLDPRFDSPIPAETSARLAPALPVHIPRSEMGATVHSEKRLRAFLTTPRANDPYADAASDDPNDDDDATDDLSGYYETNGPIIFWLQEMVRG